MWDGVRQAAVAGLGRARQLLRGTRSR
jgi:hypothetical protein